MSETYKFPSGTISSQFVKYIDRNEIEGLIGSIGHAISQKYKGQELILVSVLKGSFIFLADLVREINGVRIQIDFLKLKSLGRSADSTGTMSFEKDLSVDVNNKHVLIIEEIIDSGRAVEFLQKRIQLAKPKSLEIVTLFDKPYKRKCAIEASLIGKKIDDQFIIGYGLDLEDYGRNIQDIFFLRYPN
jgi:hypoxanthine phosphoribosyltransferase